MAIYNCDTVFNIRKHKTRIKILYDRWTDQTDIIRSEICPRFYVQAKKINLKKKIFFSAEYDMMLLGKFCLLDYL